jgi:hypothetical protein
MSMTLQQVIARLHESAVQEAQAEQAVGKTAGTEWAQERAEASQLRRLDRDPGGAIQACADAKAFYCFLNNDSVGTTDALEFWEMEGLVTGKDGMEDSNEMYAITSDFLEGFLTGAEEVWAAVKDKI